MRDDIKEWEQESLALSMIEVQVREVLEWFLWRTACQVNRCRPLHSRGHFKKCTYSLTFSPVEGIIRRVKIESI